MSKNSAAIELSLCGFPWFCEVQCASVGNTTARPLAQHWPHALPLFEAGLSCLPHTIAGRGWLRMAHAWLARYPQANPRNPITGRTPLMEAVLGGKSEMARLWLTHGADPLLVDQEGLDTVSHACWRSASTDAEMAKATDIVEQCAQAAARLGAPMLAWPSSKSPWALAEKAQTDVLRGAWERAWLECHTPDARGAGRVAARL